MNQFNKGFAALFAITILVAAILVGGGITYYVVKKYPIVLTQQIQNQQNYQQQNKQQQNVNKNTDTLNLDYTTYEGGCMIKDCKPNYYPTSTKQLTLEIGDEFGTADSYESGNLFQLVSFDDNKITVKLINNISPLVNQKRVKVGSDSEFSFSNSACFTLNNWLDVVPKYCLARSSANINLKFDVISNLNP